MSSHKTINSRAKTLIALHLLLLVYSLSGIFSKNAAHEPFLSPMFILLYGGMLAILFIYAIGWQQILKRLSLSMAFANKAVTVIWGMVWGFLHFRGVCFRLEHFGGGHGHRRRGALRASGWQGREARRSDRWRPVDDRCAGESPALRR